jgi:lysyl-tRNA synthetase class 2
MRQSTGEQGSESGNEEYLEMGIPEEWVEPLQKLGYNSVEKWKAVEKHTKLHQEMMGYRKKNKLLIRTLTPEEVKAWLGK